MRRPVTGNKNFPPMSTMLSNDAQRLPGFKPVCPFFLSERMMKGIAFGFTPWGQTCVASSRCFGVFFFFCFRQRHCQAFLVLMNWPDKCVEHRCILRSSWAEAKPRRLWSTPAAVTLTGGDYLLAHLHPFLTDWLTVMVRNLKCCVSRSKRYECWKFGEIKICFTRDRPCSNTDSTYYFCILWCCQADALRVHWCLCLPHYTHKQAQFGGKITVVFYWFFLFVWNFCPSNYNSAPIKEAVRVEYIYHKLVRKYFPRCDRILSWSVFSSEWPPTLETLEENTKGRVHSASWWSKQSSKCLSHYPPQWE